MADRVSQQLGNYRLIRLLGRGSFAEVYLGEHIYLQTQAAIKVLSTHLAPGDVEQFQREARTIARLKHAHIVRVLEFGIDDNTPFLVMDHAPHGTLRQRHPKGTRLPLPTIVSSVKQVADALQYAHDQHVVHRDIKPENMLVGEQQEILLSDFGIAIVAQSSRYESTQNIGGTMAYIAPEQIQGHPRPASDQYSLGIVVYEWLSGDYPFHGSMTEIVAQHLAVSPPSLREKVPTISPDVEQVVLTALAKDPHKRFASMQAFATALEQASQVALSETIPTSPSAPSGAVTSLRPASLPPEMGTPPIPSSRPPQTMTSRGPSQQQSVITNRSMGKLQPARQGISRRTLVLGLTGLALVGVVGGGLAWLTRSQGTQGTDLASSPTATPTNWSGWSLMPSNGVTPSALATIQSKGKEYLFVQGIDNRIYVNTFNGASWSDWSEIPGNGTTPSAPTATQYHNTTLYLFVQGTDNRIYVNTFNGASWSGWSEIPGNGITLSAPTATQYNTTLYLFVRGTDNRIYVNTFNGTNWSGWSEIPGNGITPSAPTATQYHNTLYLFVRGTDNRIYVNIFNGTNWSGWSKIPGNGITPSAPSVTQYNTTLYLFIRGTDSRIYVNTFEGTNWSGWSEVPSNGIIPSAPTATQYNTTLYLFVQSSDNRIYVNTLKRA